MSKTRPVALALTVLVTAFGLTACGQDRWCEHDATDTKVSDSYCKRHARVRVGDGRPQDQAQEDEAQQDQSQDQVAPLTAMEPAGRS